MVKRGSKRCRVRFKSLGGGQFEAVGKTVDYAITKDDEGTWYVDMFDRRIKSAKKAHIDALDFETRREAFDFVCGEEKPGRG